MIPIRCLSNPGAALGEPKQNWQYPGLHFTWLAPLPHRPTIYVVGRHIFTFIVKYDWPDERLEKGGALPPSVPVCSWNVINLAAFPFQAFNIWKMWHFNSLKVPSIVG